MIDWEDQASHLLLNPRYSQEEQDRFQNILKFSEWPGHIWLSTSGSSAQKWVGLSKGAILASAASVNQHLESNAHDIWIQALPDFHVGGLALFARAHLSGASVVNLGKWDAEKFCQLIKEQRATLSALVPTQLYDIVNQRFSAPPSMRAIIIGGGSLSSETYAKAKELQWNVLPSYGMTECASQIATAELDGSHSALKILPHIQARIEPDGRLALKSPSLLTGYAYCTLAGIEFKDPKINGWFITSDQGMILDSSLQILGRADQMIKIGGESVNIAALELRLQDLRIQLRIQSDMTLVAMPDERLGHVIHLAVTSHHPSLKELIDQFQQWVMPFERIRQVHKVAYIPRTTLSKVLQQELFTMVSSS